MPWLALLHGFLGGLAGCLLTILIHRGRREAPCLDCHGWVRLDDHGRVSVHHRATIGKNYSGDVVTSSEKCPGSGSSVFLPRGE